MIKTTLYLFVLFMISACSNSANSGNLQDTSNITAVQDSIPEYNEPVLDKDTFLFYIVDPKKQDLKIYWKNDSGVVFSSMRNLKDYIESKGKKLVFAMNAGMFMEDYRPLGLLIQNGKVVKPINKLSAPNANFYLKPNGIFYLDTENVAKICKTEDFKLNKNIKYATQSGPMILVGGEMHPACKPGSSSTCMRNGIGILPDNRILCVLSIKEINFYDFAMYFKKAGCRNALFLDGGISQMYLPEKNNEDLDNDFGPIIGVTSD